MFFLNHKEIDDSSCSGSWLNLDENALTLSTSVLLSELVWNKISPRGPKTLMELCVAYKQDESTKGIFF